MSPFLFVHISSFSYNIEFRRPSSPINRSKTLLIVTPGAPSVVNCLIDHNSMAVSLLSSSIISGGTCAMLSLSIVFPLLTHTYFQIKYTTLKPSSHFLYAALYAVALSPFCGLYIDDNQASDQMTVAISCSGPIFSILFFAVFSTSVGFF